MIQLSDRFVLMREIGSGGMSRVFLGRDETLDRPVAVKVLKTGYAGTEIGARFRREGRTAAKLSHPNIVQVYDAGEGEFEGEEASFIVMEYVSGGDLKALIDQRGALSGDHLSVMGAEVAAGLAHAHERGVIHRDIKPHNILLEEGGRARLTDFGIARALDVTQVTQTGFYLGTALYSSPEQLRGEGVTPKSDVYSLGATLYQAATGKPPFIGAPIEVASQHVSREPTPPREINPKLSGAMEALVLACMSKSPGDRPTTDEARAALLEAGREAEATQTYENAPAREPATPRTRPPAKPSGAVREGRRWRRSGVVAAIIGIAAALAVIGALAAYTLSGDGGEQANSGQANGSGQDEARPNDRPAGGGEPSDGQTATQQASPEASSSVSSEASSSASPAASSENPASGSGAGPSGDSAETAAIQTVENHYAVAAGDDYQDAWNLLSSRYQQDLGSRGQWTGQFRTLERVEYTRGPRAQVSGDTATVNFSTRAYHTDRVDEINGAVMYLVQEDGEWKIDGLEIP